MPITETGHTPSLPFHRHRDGVAAAEAKGDDAALRVAANHFVDQRREDAGAAGADGMAERNGAAVHVDARGIDAELAHHGDGLYREGLVQLVEINLVGLP